MRFRASALIGAALGISVVAADAGDGPIAAFSAAAPGDAMPSGWKRSAIKGVARATTYTLVVDEGRTVLRADADMSASAVVHKARVTPDAGTQLHWRWKVSDALKSGDPATKEGDDYAARVYVMFDYPLERLPFADRMRLRLARALYDPDLPAAALCYVWDARLPRGTVMASPYTTRVRIVVADGGSRRAGQWSTVERDVAEDFRAAFGEEPPAVSAVAVATDTDNTKESVTAWYGDIVLKKRAVTAPAER